MVCFLGLIDCLDGLEGLDDLEGLEILDKLDGLDRLDWTINLSVFRFYLSVLINSRCA